MKKTRVKRNQNKDFSLNRELIKKAQEGCEDAKNELVKLNAGMVEKLTKMYMGRIEDYDDIVQTANLALLNAIQRFDLSKNNQFSTFAYISIKGEILNYFRGNSTITKKRTSNHLFNKIQRYKYDYYALNGFFPTEQAIADYLEEDVREIKATIIENQPLSYLSDSPHDNSDDSNMTIEDVITIDNGDPYEVALLSEVVKAHLTEEETLIFNYNLEGLAKREIAKIIGVSEGKIRCVLKRTKSKLTSILALDY